MIRTILAAVDLGPVAEEVIRSADALASLFGAQLHVRHVTTSAPASPLESAAADAARRDAELLEVIVRRNATRATPDSVRLASGSPADAILTAAREVDADLIVLGPHAQQDVRARLFGTTADRVARSAGVPVLIARGAAAWPPSNLLIPTDFSATASDALRTAAYVARAAGGRAGTPKLQLLHALSSAEVFAGNGGPGGPATKRLEAAERIAADAGAADVASHVVEAEDAALGIVDWAGGHGTDLIVMGTTGRSRAQQILLGSVATKVARTAPCSVLLVPPASAASRAPALDRVAVGIDFSAAALAAVEWVLNDLVPDAARVVVHVLQQPDSAGFVSQDAEIREGMMEELRAGAAAHIAAHFPALRDDERRIVVGRTAEMLLQVAHEAAADVVVIGGHMHPRGLWSGLGSTAERLVHIADLPVLVVKGRPAGAPKLVLAAVDGSAHGARVLQWTKLLAERFGADVHLAHVLDPRYVGAARRVSGMTARRRVDRSFEQQAEAWLRNLADSAGFSADVEIEVSVGDASLELLALQQRVGADLIVVGSRGAGGVGSALLGSVAYAVVRGSTCPTLVVRG